jgi:tellurite resistance protein TerC
VEDFPLWSWAVLSAIVVVLILVDLVAFNRKDQEVGLRAAGIWSVVWLVIGIAPTAVLFAWQGGTPAGEYATGYVIERTLSLDNLFVFAVIFGYFAVPYVLQPRILMFGIIGALVLRLIFILLGAALLAAAHWVIYVFGLILIVTAYRLATSHGDEVDPAKNPVLRLIRSRFRLTDGYRGSKVFVRENGLLFATPVLGVLTVVATTDLIFAIDSIPAIFAITTEPFIVFAANAFALMGLRSLYFLLAGAMRRFEYLSYGLAVLLALVGLKMLISGVVHVPLWVTLPVIVVVLGAAIGYSLWRTRPGAPRDPDAAAVH